MNEVAYCYLEGVGCKKDKVRHMIESVQRFSPDLVMPLSGSILGHWKDVSLDDTSIITWSITSLGQEARLSQRIRIYVNHELGVKLGINEARHLHDDRNSTPSELISHEADFMLPSSCLPNITG